MRADPMDRIMSVEGPEISPVSVPRIFAAGLALPFAHPVRFLLGSILPGALIAAIGFGPMQRVVALMDLFTQTVRIAPTGNGTTTTPPPADAPPSIVGDILTLEGVMFLALALWLCAWQRAAARNFAEPLPRWFGTSLLRLPGYILAFMIWVLTPAVVIVLPFAAMVALIALNMGAGWAIPAQEAAGEMAAIPAMLGDLQWLILMVVFVTMALIALWLSARLSPLPALVASRGWRSALSRAWALSRGHGLGLSVSMVAYSLFGLIVMAIGDMVVGGVMAARAGNGLPDLSSVVAVDTVINLIGAVLIVNWQASLGALVVRDGLSPAESLDPALFD